MTLRGGPPRLCALTDPTLGALARPPWEAAVAAALGFTLVGHPGFLPLTDPGGGAWRAPRGGAAVAPALGASLAPHPSTLPWEQLVAALLKTP